MKRWIVAIIFSNLGRFFNNPNLIWKLEDRLANSGPVKQFARTIVALYQRASWEIKQLSADGPKRLTERPFTQEDLQRKLKQWEEDLKRRTGQR